MFKEDETQYCKNCYELREQLDQLKEQLEAYKMEADEGKEINAELKAENEELKFQNKRLEEVALYWHKRIFKVERSERKLKQTLTEIKEIAEHCIKQDICTTCDNSNRCHIEDEEIPTYDVCKLILQKISEVEDEKIH